MLLLKSPSDLLLANYSSCLPNNSSRAATTRSASSDPPEIIARTKEATLEVAINARTCNFPIVKSTKNQSL